VFGEEFQREVLNDIDRFAMPESAARILNLPEKSVNLNRGLHSMPTPAHSVQKRILSQILTSAITPENPTAGWKEGTVFPLVKEMRALMLDLATRVMFGRERGSRLGELVSAYFQLRRDATSPGQIADAATIEELAAHGAALDAALRSYVRDQAGAGDGLLANLALLARAGDASMTEDQAVGHLNVLFISSTEPLAVALSWTVLILSQLPQLRAALREEMIAANGRLEGMVLMNGIIQESLRLLPPNAFMVRLTSQPARLGNVTLPAHCEVILCPFVSHRDAAAFGNPMRFQPERWKGPPPSPWIYFPFGAGGHACVGKVVAMRLLKTALAFLLSRFDLVLQDDQEVDWRLHVQFMPATDPIMAAYRVGSPEALRAGKLGGPVGNLIDLTGKLTNLTNSD
jgi:cytochrome P450